MPASLSLAGNEERHGDFMKKFLKFFIGFVVVFIFAFIYYYITLPAINFHSPGFWWFLISLFLIISVVLGLSGFNMEKGIKRPFNSARSNLFKVFAVATGGIIIIFIIGSIASSPMINSSKYQKLLTITDRDFNEDIKEISYKDIPVLDRASATLLGSRKMGSIVEYVSQFEVADNYTQINYQDVPTRVSPLRYGNLFKWLTNKDKGIPAYMKIDMATQEVSLVKLEQGIKYSESDHFGRYINRYLRFHYPTYIFDTISFEINDEGTPYWICPVKDYTIGLFGGQTVGKVVIVNAVTGEHAAYNIDEVPQWVDRVYSAELLISLYDYYGTLKHGYWNSVFSQRDALKTTDGYNYIALEDDVWIYTGVTSVGGDESNVGFVLMNQRTAETRYYAISGAEEYSAMASAEGKVQHLGYKSTFPLLLNVSGEPTYFIAMKDAAGLVKAYAMVNIAQYQIVAIGDSIAACEKEYNNLLASNNIQSNSNINILQVTGIISKIAQGVVDGNSHYYILLNNNDEIFDVNIADFISIIKYDIGNTITFTYKEGTDANIVKGIE